MPDLSYTDVFHVRVVQSTKREYWAGDYDDLGIGFSTYEEARKAGEAELAPLNIHNLHNVGAYFEIVKRTHLKETQ